MTKTYKVKQAGWDYDETLFMFKAEPDVAKKVGEFEMLLAGFKEQSRTDPEYCISDPKPELPGDSKLWKDMSSEQRRAYNDAVEGLAQRQREWEQRRSTLWSETHEARHKKYRELQLNAVKEAFGIETLCLRELVVHLGGVIIADDSEILYYTCNGFQENEDD